MLNFNVKFMNYRKKCSVDYPLPNACNQKQEWSPATKVNVEIK